MPMAANSHSFYLFCVSFRSNNAIPAETLATSIVACSSGDCGRYPALLFVLLSIALLLRSFDRCVVIGIVSLTAHLTSPHGHVVTNELTT